MISKPEDSAAFRAGHPAGFWFDDTGAERAFHISKLMNVIGVRRHWFFNNPAYEHLLSVLR
jgi:hypothetical protein